MKTFDQIFILLGHLSSNINNIIIGIRNKKRNLLSPAPVNSLSVSCHLKFVYDNCGSLVIVVVITKLHFVTRLI